MLVCAAKPGQWSSGEEGVISLDADSGVAVAVATGRALVYHNVDGLVDTHTEVSSNCVYVILLCPPDISSAGTECCIQYHRRAAYIFQYSST